MQTSHKHFLSFFELKVSVAPFMFFSSKPQLCLTLRIAALGFETCSAWAVWPLSLVYESFDVDQKKLLTKTKYQ